MKGQIHELARSKGALVAAASALSLLAGAAVGYVVAQKKFEKVLEQEIADLKEYYALYRKEGQYADPEELAKFYEDQIQQQVDVQEAAKIIESEGYAGSAPLYDEPQLTPKIITQNVFTDHIEDVPDEALEVEEQVKTAPRSKDRPYIITKQEYDENETEYEQIVLSYFSKDDVLADVHDKPLTDNDKYVGDDNLDNFGWGSNDPNVVYVRNEKLELEFEINHSTGSFAKEVLGFNDQELRHSDGRQRIRKFRGDDE